MDYDVILFYLQKHFDWLFRHYITINHGAPRLEYDHDEVWISEAQRRFIIGFLQLIHCPVQTMKV